MKKIYLLFVLLVFISCQKDNKFSIIPQPNKIEELKGTFNFRTIDYIKAEPCSMDAAKFMAEQLSSFTGQNINADHGSTPIILCKNDSIAKEGYILSVKDSTIEIQASDYAGNIHAMYTLMQLMPEDVWDKKQTETIYIPCCRIEDSPRFSYRGMHLDVSRHFFSVEEIKKYIDVLAIHKLNKFHWHLTDDQGWRIEIKKYPLLTSVAAWRAERGSDTDWASVDPQFDGEQCTYGGFYTQEEAKEIVKYAKDRAIDVIPEIEFPGHSSEVFSAYPSLSCSGKAQPVPTGGGSGYSKSPSSVYCAGKEEVFEFIKDVLTEVVDIFPEAPYIHIGGDEVGKLAWKQCRNCKRRMRQEGLSNTDELQSYFIKRVEEISNDLGKPIIGWDEILEGGIAPNATVMSWRGTEGGIKAAKAGHDVIMTPGSYLYFDNLQSHSPEEPKGSGYVTTEKVYSYEPIPQELTEEEAKHILGAQANLWTENIWTFDHLTYMLIPRICALSEVVWSNNKNWEDFTRRLSTDEKRLQDLGYNCHKGCTDININTTYDDGKFIVSMSNQIYGADIRYTTDGSKPNLDSKLYKRPIKIKESTRIKALLFKDKEALTEAPTVQSITFHKGIGKKVTYNTPYSSEYPGKGDVTLVDGINSSLDLRSGLVQGFCESDFDITIDLEKETEIQSVTAGFIQSVSAWVYFPTKLTILVSNDGENFTEVANADIENNPRENLLCRRDVNVQFEKTQAKFVRIIGKNDVTEPGLPGGGKVNWIFADEIVVE